MLSLPPPASSGSSSSSSSDEAPERIPGTLLEIFADTACCTICGAPVGDDHDGSTHWHHLPDWWKLSALLSESKAVLTQDKVRVTPVKSCGGFDFQQVDPGRESFRAFEGFQNQTDVLYLPVHIACLQMAKRFIHSHASRRTVEQSENGLTSMWRLWQILKSRTHATNLNCKDPDNDDMAPEDFWILHPHDYYGAFWCKPQFWEEEFERRRIDSDDSMDSSLTVYPEYFEANPMKISGVPGFLISHLTPLHSTHLHPEDLIGRAFARRLDRLPPEILDMILKHLLWLDDPPLVCNRLLKPYLWRRALLTQDIFPWLWNINRLVKASHGLHRKEEKLSIKQYMALKFFDNMWDWELLVRQLAQTDVFEPGTHLAHSGLRNRRRIWRILDEMRIGDVPVDSSREQEDGSSMVE